jgi:hypothetical protein
MSETHTPFTSQELIDLVCDAGFEVADITSLAPMDRHWEYYGMTLESAVKPSNRHIVLQANKCE